MTPQQELKISKQIRLAVIALGLTILTTFGGGAAFIVTSLLHVEHRLTVNEELRQQVTDNKEAVKVVNIRVDNVEGRMFDLASLIKNK